jgi:hypothetical protein
MKIKELMTEARETYANGFPTDPSKVPHFGFESKANAKIAEKAIKDAGIETQKDFNFGITYFSFKTKKDINAALKIIKPLIDKTKESEW